MTVHKVKYCTCGHPVAWHDKATGRCTYGKDHAMGGCPCQHFSKRKRATARDVDVIVQRDVSPPNDLDTAIDDTIRALTALKKALGHRPTNGIAEAARKVTGGLDLSILPPPRRTSKPVVIPADSAKLRKGEREILRVIAENEPRRLTKIQIGTLVGIKGRGTTMSTYLGVLKRADLIEINGELVTLSAEGKKVTKDVPRRQMSRDDILAIWLPRLRAGERSILEMVANHGSTTRSNLGVHTGIDPTGTTMSTYLGVLKRNDLIVINGSSVSLGSALKEAS